MGGKSSDAVVGYWYFAGMHLVLCHGPVDAITKIIVGERIAWAGNQTASGGIYIDKRNLFGGDQREGGILGIVEIAMGEATQTANDYLAATMGGGGPIPAFRGVVSLILRRVALSAMNPYIKPWSIEAKRIPKGWYGAKAAIGDDANPAHILHEVLTDQTWGLGYNPSDLDLASFQAAADRLYAESFGLSLLWSDQKSASDFINDVLRHVDGSLYVHPRTGLFALKLVRDDYNPAALPVFDPSNIVSLDEFTRIGLADRVNQVVVSWVDELTYTALSVTVQDMATFALQNGQVVSVTNDYPGISNAALANTVAFRDLRKQSAPLVKVSLTVNRAGAALMVGDVFKLNWPDLGITGMIFRVAHADYGTLQAGVVKLDCLQDIFSLGAASYGPPAPSGWTSPGNTPASMNHRKLVEAPYYTLIRNIVGENPSAIADINSMPTAGLLVAMGSAPSADAPSFEVWTRQGAASFAYTGINGNPCPFATLQSACGPGDAVLALNNALNLDFATPGNYAYLGSECVGIVSVDLNAMTATVQRGVLDTVPAVHEAGESLWFAEGYQALVRAPIYLAGESVDARLLTHTSQGILDIAAAPTNSYTFNERFYRPYPPGNLKLNGSAYPASITGPLQIIWSHRDRTLQTAALNPTTDGDIGPEIGVTYNLRLYNETNALVTTVTGLTGTSYTWGTEIADSGLGRYNNNFRLELESSRGGLVSGQPHNVTCGRTGGLTGSDPSLGDPAGFTATGIMDGITWSWTGGAAGDHFELVISPTNNRNDPSAQTFNTGTALSYTQNIETGPYYAWVRELTPAGAWSGNWVPASATAGLTGNPEDISSALVDLVTP